MNFLQALLASSWRVDAAAIILAVRVFFLILSSTMSAVSTPPSHVSPPSSASAESVQEFLRDRVLPTLTVADRRAAPQAIQVWRHLSELPLGQVETALEAIIVGDGDRGQVKGAISTLGALRCPRAPQILKAVVLTQGDPEVVAEAARRLVYSCGRAGRELARHWLSDGASELESAPLELARTLQYLVQEARGALVENLPWGDAASRASMRLEAEELGAGELPNDGELVRELMTFAREYVPEVSFLAIKSLRRHFGELGRAACRDVLMELRSPVLSSTGDASAATLETRYESLRGLDSWLLGEGADLFAALRVPGLHDLGDVAVHRLMRAWRDLPRVAGADGALVTFLEQRATPEAARALGELNAVGQDDAQKALLRLLRFSSRYSPDVVTQARIGYWRRADIEKVLPQISNLPELFGEGKSLEAFGRELASAPDTRSSLRHLQRLQEYAERRSLPSETAALRAITALQCRRWATELGDSTVTLTIPEMKQLAVAAYDLAVSHADEAAGQLVMERALAGYEENQPRFREPLLAFFNELGRISGDQIPSICVLSERVAMACGEVKDRTVLKEALTLQYAPLGLVLIGSALRAAGEPQAEMLVRKRITGLRWGSLQAAAQAERLVMTHLATGANALDQIVTRDPRVLVPFQPRSWK